MPYGEDFTFRLGERRGCLDETIREKQSESYAVY